eukprot:scaffold136487_cov16-Tisochrysis_lutea.AAC.1
MEMDRTNQMPLDAGASDSMCVHVQTTPFAPRRARAAAVSLPMPLQVQGKAGIYCVQQQQTPSMHLFQSLSV